MEKFTYVFLYVSYGFMPEIYREVDPSEAIGTRTSYNLNSIRKNCATLMLVVIQLIYTYISYAWLILEFLLCIFQFQISPTLSHIFIAS